LTAPADASVLDSRVLAADGAATTLRSQLHAGPLAVVFVRHFGCIFCRERAAQLCARKAEFERRGVRVVLVGSGAPDKAARFAGLHGCGFPVFTDPTLGVQKSAGLRRGLASTLRLGALVNLVRALRAGFRQTAVEGDAWQQGGALVFDGDGRLRHAQVDRVAGDPLDLDRLLAALPPEGAPAAGSTAR
jgi:peroxiredoxin